MQTKKVSAMWVKVVSMDLKNPSFKKLLFHILNF